MFLDEAQQAKALCNSLPRGSRPPNSCCQCSRKLSGRFVLSMLRGGAGPGSGSSGTQRGLCGLCSHQMGARGTSGARGRASWMLGGGVLAAALVLGAGPPAFPPAFPALGPGAPSRPGFSQPRPSSQVSGAGACGCLKSLSESRPAEHKIKWRERMNFCLVVFLSAFCLYQGIPGPVPSQTW